MKISKEIFNAGVSLGIDTMRKNLGKVRTSS